MTLQSTWRESAKKLRDKGIDTPLLDARLLLQEACSLSYEEFLLQSKSELTTAQESIFSVLLARRLRHEPVSQIIGWREFWGRKFTVTRDVLTPRPDSEAIIEGVLKRLPDKQKAYNILDLGTGTGCLLLTLVAELPNARGTAVDVSTAALAVARENALSLGLSERVEFIESRWFEAVPAKKYEIVVANPPYIPSNDVSGLMPEVAKFEPHLALDGGIDGLKCYREIASQLSPYLANEALVAVEVGAGQHLDVARIMENEQLKVSAVLPDLSGIARCIILSGK